MYIIYAYDIIDIYVDYSKFSKEQASLYIKLDDN